VTTPGDSVGRPGVCAVAGAVMLGVPVAMELVAPPARNLDEANAGLLVTVVLAFGALGIVLAIARPRSGAMPALAVLCVALALLLVPSEPIGDGVAGFACLAFLLAMRLHRQSREGQVTDVEAWLVAHRPMLVGAGVTTPAAIATAIVPAQWSLPVAALVGLVLAVVSAVWFLR
jgi:hypothetical protein